MVASVLMGPIRGFLVVWMTMSLIIVQNSSNVEGRFHHHKKPKNKAPPVSPSPVYTPIPSDPSPPTDLPSVPSDPYPTDPGTSSSGSVFSVMSYGGVGDGSADDTAAFREAWIAACAVESGVVLAPANYRFKITSTIFSGPCKPGLVFQVRIILLLLFCSFQYTVSLIMKLNNCS